MKYTTHVIVYSVLLLTGCRPSETSPVIHVPVGAEVIEVDHQASIVETSGFEGNLTGLWVTKDYLDALEQTKSPREAFRRFSYLLLWIHAESDTMWMMPLSPWSTESFYERAFVRIGDQQFAEVGRRFPGEPFEKCLESCEEIRHLTAQQRESLSLRSNELVRSSNGMFVKIADKLATPLPWAVLPESLINPVFSQGLYRDGSGNPVRFYEDGRVEGLSGVERYRVISDFSFEASAFETDVIELLPGKGLFAVVSTAAELFLFETSWPDEEPNRQQDPTAGAPTYHLTIVTE